MLPDRIKLAIGRVGHAYRSVFNGPAGEDVLRDLALFCRAADTTFHPDARVQAQLEGRREVWLRIQKFLQLTPEQLYELRFPNGRVTSERIDEDG